MKKADFAALVCPEGLKVIFASKSLAPVLVTYGNQLGQRFSHLFAGHMASIRRHFMQNINDRPSSGSGYVAPLKHMPSVPRIQIGGLERHELAI